MPRGYWRERFTSKLIIGLIIGAITLVVGCGAIGWGFSKQVQYEWHSNERSAEYARNTYRPAYNACLRRSHEDQSNCIAKANDEYRKNAHDEQDLIAQQTTAVWTFLMGGAAIVGMMLSSLGVFLVWTTFHETREANEISREGGRAWIGFRVGEEAGEPVTLCISPDRLKLKLAMIIENYGESPALSVWCDGFISFSKPTEIDIIEKIKIQKPTDDHARTIAYPKINEGSEIEIIHEGERPLQSRLFVTVFANYRVAGVDGWRHTAFPYEIKPEGAARLFRMADGEFMLTCEGNGELASVTLHRGSAGLPIAS